MKKYTFEEVKNKFEDRGYVLLETEYINNNTKMKYQCSKHPDKELYLSLACLNIGVKCPYCEGELSSARQRKPFEEVKMEFENSGYHLLSVESDYINSKSKLKYLCNHHLDKGILEITYSSLHNGSGCYWCGRESLSKKQMFDYDFVKSKFEDKGYILVSKEYTGTFQKLEYICPSHEDKGIQKISFTKLHNRNQGCPYCAGVKQKTHDEYTKLVNDINPNIMLLSEYKTMNDKMTCQCLVCDTIWSTSASHLVSEIPTGCPCCAIICRSEKLAMTFKEFIKRLFAINSDIEIIGEYINSSTNVLCKCKIDGHEWSARPQHLLNGHGCPACNKSKGEEKIANILNGYCIDFKRQYTFNDLVGKYNHLLKFDFALFDRDNLIQLIEYDGEFHYFKIHEDYDFERAQILDEMKNNYTKNNNIPLLRIPYWEFDNLEYIIKDALINYGLMSA